MARILERLTTARAATGVLVAVLSLVVSTHTFAGQGRNRGGGGTGSSGQAVPRTAPPAPAPPPASAPAPAPRSGPAEAMPRSTPATDSTRTPQDGEESSGRRPGGRATTGTAVPRGSVQRPPGGGTTVIVSGDYYGGFWPWGFGGLGFGAYYGGGFYDPYSPWYGGDGDGQPLAATGPTGSMRLKIKPRDAQVFVDGFYAGIVDDFDGVFQRLHVQAGPHRIEVRAVGYETLSLDVEFRPEQTVKYEGDLQRLP